MIVAMLFADSVLASAGSSEWKCFIGLNLRTTGDAYAMMALKVSVGFIFSLRWLETLYTPWRCIGQQQKHQGGAYFWKARSSMFVLPCDGNELNAMSRSTLSQTTRRSICLGLGMRRSATISSNLSGPTPM